LPVQFDHRLRQPLKANLGPTKLPLLLQLGKPAEAEIGTPGT
jgi:hypothetical protein